MQTNAVKIFLLSIGFIFIYLPIQALLPDSGSLLPGTTGNAKTVLIINSYHPETKWSEEVTSGLKSALKQQFPDIHIYNGNLNIEEAATDATTLLSLRAIIWQMAEQEGDTINPESRNKNSFYRIKKTPDVIVCIGEEAYFEHLQLHLWQGNWSEVPLVLCAVNDSVIVDSWAPGDVCDMSSLRSTSDPLNKETGNFFANDSTEKHFEKALAAVGLKLSDKITRKNPDGRTKYITKYHTTGVIAETPVRENLELLKQLMPGLKEIVWIDNYFYKSAYILHRLRQELPHIFPDARLTVIHHNGMNTDSIYDIMLQPLSDRVFITYSWNISGVYSRRPEQQIDSLFRHALTSPILTLSERPINKPYWLGGVHISAKNIIVPTVTQIRRILNGTPADSIPFEKIIQTEILLNVPTLKHFELEKRASQIEGIIYKNIPPSFYEQYERVILISILIIIVLTGSIILIVKRILYTRKSQTEYVNYHKLYKRLEAIYQNSDIDFALYDKDGILLTRIIDGKEEVVHHLTGIFSDKLFHSPWLSEHMKQDIQAGNTVNEEIEAESPDHESSQSQEKSRWNVIIKPLQGTTEQKAHYIAIAIDLTPLVQERKTKERSEYIFQFATETAKIGVASYNLLSGKGFASSIWHNNLNEPPKNDTPPTYENVCEEDRKILLAYQQRIRTEEVSTPFIRTIQVIDSEGIHHYVQQYIFVREYAPEQQTISVVELNLNYDKPKQRENELQQARKKAEASNLETEQFLANISHEIRTPLNAIVGFSSILANSTDEEEINVLAPIIEQNNNLLIALIDNILYLSKLDSGTLTFRYDQVEIHPLFDGLAGYAQEQIQQKEINVITDIPAIPEKIYLAEVQFNLVMNNLISNAAKFTTKGEITIGYEKREHEYYFFVKDTGPGIHMVNQENIFKRFNKLDVFTQGTGLGLALCRSIVTHQGGQIGVISPPGQGSTFWFTLPENQEINQESGY